MTSEQETNLLTRRLRQWQDTSKTEHLIFISKYDKTIVNKHDMKLYYFKQIKREKETRTKTYKRSSTTEGNHNPRQFRRADMNGVFAPTRETWLLIVADTHNATQKRVNPVRTHLGAHEIRIGKYRISAEQRQHLVESMGNKHGRLEASTDGTGRNGKGGFGYILYETTEGTIGKTKRQKTKIIYEGYGPSDGFKVDYTRADLDGVLAILLLIDVTAEFYKLNQNSKYQ